ncbi:MAG: DUF6351 family protein [Candidatus Dormibacteria bacterium]
MLSLTVLAPAVAQAAQLRPGGDVVIKVLSNRADLVSGGDALVQVLLPAGVAASAAKVDVDGRDVTNSLAAGRMAGLMSGIPPRNNLGVDLRANSLLGVVSGLKVGTNVLSATLPDGYGARIVITNHPIGGPVFAGPQAQPWICTTNSNGLGNATDSQCNAPTTFTYMYKNTATGQFSAYDPSSPPPGPMIATTTTDQGHTVPYIVRDERGTIDRGIYDVAVLFDPSKPWVPWAPQAGWNHKLGFKFGGGCAPGHSQQTAQNPLDDMFLSRGYMVGVSSIDVNGNSCNPTTSAESLMMIKERIAESYGPIRFTMGDGCSGGAEQQHSIAEQYPGLLDGIRPECTFPDLWTIAIWEKHDCAVLMNYFDNISPALWANPLDRGAVIGGALTPGICAETAGLGGAAQDWDPAGSGCGLPAGSQYNATSNPRGARCTLQDYNVNALGVRASDGYANRPIDHVGLQWGLKALQAGQITVAQFVDLNRQVGDTDVNFVWQKGRASGDIPGIQRMYTADELTYGANLAKVPEIEARGDDTFDEHSNVMHEIVRARLDAAVGSHASNVYWAESTVGAFGLPSPPLHTLTFTVMDQWLTMIEADSSTDPIEVKVVRDKPAAAVDSCYSGASLAPQSACDAVHTTNLLPVQVAGEPKSAMVLKCQLKPLSKADYPGITFSDTQWADLQAAFPSGVCDWSKPGVAEQPPVGDWLTFASAVGGVPLGAAPVSVPFGPARPVAGDPRGTPNTSGAHLPPHRLAVAAAAAILLALTFLCTRRARAGGRRPR